MAWQSVFNPAAPLTLQFDVKNRFRRTFRCKKSCSTLNRSHHVVMSRLYTFIQNSSPCLICNSKPYNSSSMKRKVCKSLRLFQTSFSSNGARGVRCQSPHPPAIACHQWSPWSLGSCALSVQHRWTRPSASSWSLNKWARSTYDPLESSWHL